MEYGWRHFVETIFFKKYQKKKKKKRMLLLTLASAKTHLKHYVLLRAIIEVWEPSSSLLNISLGICHVPLPV
jgi:hypothetical protein